MRIGGRLLASIILVGGFCAVAQLAFPSQSVSADVTSSWLNATSPTLDKIGDLDAKDLTYSNTHNQSCQDQEIITLVSRKLPTPQTKKSQTGCVVNTKFGALSINGYLHRPGSIASGELRNANGGAANLVPIPSSNTVINLFGSLFTGYYLQFFDDLDTSITSSVIYSGEVEHRLPVTSSKLTDKSGSLIVVAHDSISFSANGDWMVADLPWLGAARINTKTRDVLVFGDLMNYNGGYGIGFGTAISPDGRYVVMTTNSPNMFKVYDLSTCVVTSQTVTIKANCSSQDFFSFMSKMPGYGAAMGIRFKDDYSLDMTIYSNGKYSHQLLTAAGQQPATYQYLALGDSFASGEGAYQYKALTDTNNNKCHLSQRSYPYLISSQLGFGQYESVACSGALIADLVSKDAKYEGQVKDHKKLDERNLSNILDSFSAGYVGQIEFSSHYQPKIITLSAVGNDIGFSDKIKRCIDTDTCYSSYEDRLEIVNEINAQFYRLTDLYTQIKNTGDPRAKIYVIGYPDIAYPDGNCADNVHLNHQELVFAQQLVSYLNSVIKMAASNVGVAYVDVENALAGHRFCETNSWSVAVNGLTAGNDIANIPLLRGPIGNESYHPNFIGQDLLKTKILAQTNNLSLPMPAPNPSSLVPDPTDSLPILNAPKSNRPVRIIKNVTGTNGGVIEFGKTWATEYSGIGLAFKMGSTVHGWLNSDPVDLGTFTPDAESKLTIQMTLPTTVPSGFHTLHFYGKNTSDEDVDLHQTVYVSDGKNQQCVVVPNSGNDSDKDKIDDACDLMIDQPPLEVAPDSPLVKIVDPTQIPPTALPLTVIDTLPELSPPKSQNSQTAAQPSTSITQLNMEPPANAQQNQLISAELLITAAANKPNKAAMVSTVIKNFSDISQVKGTNTSQNSLAQLYATPKNNITSKQTRTKFYTSLLLLFTLIISIGAISITKKLNKTT